MSPSPQPQAPVDFDVVKVRSLLVPRWWQVRWRYRWLKLQRTERRRREALSPGARAMEDEITARLDRAFLGVADDA